MSELSTEAKCTIVVAVVILLIVMFVFLNNKKSENYSSDRDGVKQGRWNCYPGFNVPIRKFGKDVQCLSTDGVNCHWKNTAAECVNALDKRGNPVLASGQKLNPLVCGPMHKKIYNITGYDTTGHWCNAIKSNRNERD